MDFGDHRRRFVMIPAFEALSRLDWNARKKQAADSMRKNRELARQPRPSRPAGPVRAIWQRRRTIDGTSPWLTGPAEDLFSAAEQMGS